MLPEVEGRVVLTVADSAGFGERGVAVNFFLENDRVRFEINLATLRRDHLEISAKLLRLARLLKSDPPADTKAGAP